MPEPLTIALGGVAVVLLLLLGSVARYYRLRNAIDETAAAVAAQRQRLEELVTNLEGARPVRPDDPQAHANGQPTRGGEQSLQLRERLAEAEDRLAAVHHLHAAQVRAWNGATESPLWRALRPLTGWKPIPEPPDEERSSTTGRGEAA